MPLYPELNPVTEPTSTTSAINMVSLEVAKDLLIKFDGTKPKLFEFIDNCDEAMNIIKTELKPTLLTIIKTKLTDNARFLIRNREFNDWKSLKTLLIETYADNRTMNQWQLELNSCKQNFNESISSYSNKIENCYIKLVNSLDKDLTKDGREACTKLLKTQALNVFISGLQKDISILIKSQRPSSLEEAISLALAEEQELKSKNEIQKYQSVNHNNAKFCNFCNKPGHTSFYCRSRKDTQHVRHYQTRQSNNFSQSSKSFNQSSNMVNPSNSNFSRARMKSCNYCKKPGHEIHECRKLQYINQMRSNPNSQNSINNSISRNSPSTSNIPKPPPVSSQTPLNTNIPKQTAMSRNTHSIQAELQS